MPAYRSIRLEMRDRPGALSVISAALGEYQVDIVRLDVVAHEGEIVVDDLYLKGPDALAIGNAIAAFPFDARVRTFETESGDPALEAITGLREIASASSLAAARRCFVEHTAGIARADGGMLVRAGPEGGCEILSPGDADFRIAADEPFIGRWCLQRQQPIAFPSAPGWAPESLQRRLGAAWVTIAPSGPFDAVVLARRLNIPFYHEELERLSGFVQAAGAILRLQGDQPSTVSIPAGRQEELPADAVILNNGIRVG